MSFIKGGYSFRRVHCNRELIPDCWRSYKESMFAKIELSFRNINLFGNGCSMVNKTRVLRESTVKF